jgi:hypothetical protein
VFCSSLVLILPVPRVPGVQGGLIFLRLKDFFLAVLLCTKGSTKRTLFGIVLFKLNNFCFHVFLRSLVLILPVPRVSGVYRGLIIFSLVLILCIPVYLGIKGDRFFSGLIFFLAVVLCTNWCTTICITCPILCKIECNEFVCIEFVLVLLQIDITQSVLYTLVLLQIDITQAVLYTLFYINL